MTKKLPRLHWILFCCLLFLPVSLRALEFKMPKDVADEESSDVSDEEKDYGDSKNPLNGIGRPAKDVPTFTLVDEDGSEKESEGTDFIEFPLLEAEAEIINSCPFKAAVH